MSTEYLFLDTNIFLHYRQFNENDWLQCITGRHATLVLTPIVLSELDKHKDQHPHKRIRDRAGRTIKGLNELLKAADTIEWYARATLRSGSADVLFLTVEPVMEFAHRRLDSQVSDDRLLASLLEFADQHPADAVRLLTTDPGLQAKARTRSITVGEPPEQWKLPDEPDPLQQKVVKLEQELRELQLRAPLLSVKIPGSESDRVIVSIPNPEIWDSVSIAARLDAVKQAHPKTGNVITYSLGDNGEKLNRREHDYSREHDEFYAKYERYLQDLSAHNAIVALTFALELQLFNDGTMPAEEIEVSFTFPSDLKVWDKESEEENGEFPAAPEEPVLGSIAEKLLLFARDIHADAKAMDRLRASVAHVGRPTPNVSSLRLHRKADYTKLVVTVRKLNHYKIVSLGTVSIQFPSADMARSFSIDGLIIANNIPKQLHQTIHVLVQKEKGG